MQIFAEIIDGFYVLTVFAKNILHRCIIGSQIHPWHCKGVIRTTVTGAEDSKIVAKRYHWDTSVQTQDFSWSIFSYGWTDYGELRSKSSYAARLRENTDQKKLNFTMDFFSSGVATACVSGKSL